MSGSLRFMLKRSAERVLVAGGAPEVVRRLRTGHDLILAYHNIVPSGEKPGGDRSLHLSVEDFALQLDALIRSHEVVPLTELFENTANRGSRSTPLAAITFDDGYVGSLTAGLRELERRKLPATYFISPGLLGRDGFWWDVLADPERRGPPPELRRAALTQHCGRIEDVFDHAASRGVDFHPQPRHAGVASEELLAEAVKTPGIRLGSHTWSHASLDALEGKELSDELRRPLRWLERRFGSRAVPWLSLPYGRSGAGVRSEASDAGYEGVLRVSGGLVGRDCNRFAVPRVNVPAGLSVDGFLLRTAGL